MWPAIIGGLIGAGGSILGGLMGSNAAQRGQDIQLEIAERNIAMQKEFAQMGVQWKAEDARKAGVHPLFGLGASTSSFSPVSVGTPSTDYSWAGNAGQHLGRAAAAAMNRPDREQMAHDAMHQQFLQTERQNLENELLRTQIRRMNQEVGPPMPFMGQRSPGGGNTGDIISHPTLGEYEKKPPESTPHMPGFHGHASGPAQPAVAWRLLPSGVLQAEWPKGFPGEDELGAPMSARWWVTASHSKPPPSVIADTWPGAIDATWSTPYWGWKPVYPQYLGRGHLRPSQIGPSAWPAGFDRSRGLAR